MYSTTYIYIEMDLVPVALPSQVEVSLTTILGLLALIYGIEYGLVGKPGEAPGAGCRGIGKVFICHITMYMYVAYA